MTSAIHRGVRSLSPDVRPPLDAGPYEDTNISVVAVLVVVGIHAFRMPIVFVMAGFFTALLLQQRGVAGLLQNRVTRVVVPFALFIHMTLMTVLPILLVSYQWSHGHHPMTAKSYLRE